ncbi:hypothetical protein DER44DRAFT_849248 [Fusarium oxysporum]|nr:hypothetical protein DER44DRAFT_849248 [Fusarium oxysporum]
MAGEIQSTGLATLSEVYSAIIPTLSVENKLPLVDNIIELAREQARPHEERSDMKKVTEVYIWLIKTARLFPNDTQFVVRSTAAILNHLGELVKFTEVSDPLKVTDPPQVANHKPKEPLLQLQEQVESELKLDDPESRSTFIRLMVLYNRQGRRQTLPLISPRLQKKILPFHSQDDRLGANVSSKMKQLLAGRRYIGGPLRKTTMHLPCYWKTM